MVANTMLTRVTWTWHLTNLELNGICLMFKPDSHVFFPIALFFSSALTWPWLRHLFGFRSVDRTVSITKDRVVRFLVLLPEVDFNYGAMQMRSLLLKSPSLNFFCFEIKDDVYRVRPKNPPDVYHLPTLRWSFPVSFFGAESKYQGLICIILLFQGDSSSDGWLGERAPTDSNEQEAVQEGERSQKIVDHFK